MTPMRPLSILFVLLLAAGCGGKTATADGSGNGGLGAGAGGDAGADASPVDGALAPGDVALDTSGGAIPTDTAVGPVGPCNPPTRGLVFARYLSMKWDADECQPDGSCIQVVHADGCHLLVQRDGAVFEHDMTAADCELLGSWMGSSELITAVKSDYKCAYTRGNLDVLEVNDDSASTSYKVPPNCVDSSWVDHRACMQYLVDAYGR